jgi:hypothetical protein
MQVTFNQLKIRNFRQIAERAKYSGQLRNI